MHVKEQQVTSCRSVNKFITVDATKALPGENIRKMDMDQLHTCCTNAANTTGTEKIAATGAALFLQQGKWDDKWNA